MTETNQRTHPPPPEGVRVKVWPPKLTRLVLEVACPVCSQVIGTANHEAEATTLYARHLCDSHASDEKGTVGG